MFGQAIRSHPKHNMTQTTVSVTLKTATRRPAGRGFMIIGTGLVDGTETDVIFWDPENEQDLAPGAVLNVEFDGKTAFWNERNGKTSFQVRGTANYTVESRGEGSPAGSGGGSGFGQKPAQAYPGATAQPKKSAEEILDRAKELVTIYSQKLAEAGVPAEVVAIAAPMAPTIVSSWWFGDGKWA